MTDTPISINGIIVLVMCIFVLAVATAEAAGPPYFTNVASVAVVDEPGSGNAAVWLDYDNDTDQDLYVVNDPGNGKFYRNNGNGTFTSLAVGLRLNGNHAAVADYDKSNYVDVALGWHSGGAAVFKNNGNGTFTDVTGPAGISITNSAKPIWGDYNNDSYPDLYFGMGAQKLYRNNKDGTFSDVTAAILPPVTATEVTPAWIDYDKDNHVDLFLSPNSGTMMLFHYNTVTGVFDDVSTAAGINLAHLPGSSHRPAVGDYTGNAFPDIYVFGGGSSNYLFRNEGDGTFAEVAGPAGVKTTAGSGMNGNTAFLDFDRDGDLDLFANGGRYGSNNFFLNNSDGTFTDITPLTGLSNTDDSHDIAVGDFNGDGYPDIYEVNFTGYGSSRNKLFQNDVPEPATLSLLALAPLVALRRRRR